MPEGGWAKVGEAVSGRRLRLQLTQAQVVARGGPSDVTLRKIEQGSSGPYRQSTLDTLESILKWRPGTIRDIREADPDEPVSKWIDLPDANTGPGADSARFGVVLGLPAVIPDYPGGWLMAEGRDGHARLRVGGRDVQLTADEQVIADTMMLVFKLEKSTLGEAAHDALGGLLLHLLRERGELPEK